MRLRALHALSELEHARRMLKDLGQDVSKIDKVLEMARASELYREDQRR